MLVVFMIIQALSTVLTVSLGPLFGLMSLSYEVDPSRVHILYGLSALACFVAFYPTNAIIAKWGTRMGLTFCLVGAYIGGGLCCLINTNYNLFLVGYFLMQFWVQAVHSAKGNFVNMFYKESQVRKL